MYHNLELIGHPNHNFNHCSSIIVHNGKVVIVGYCGQECTDEQRVFIMYKSGNKDKYIEFKPKTGNPIIWIYDSKVNIIYSRFEDHDGNGSIPQSPVDRWKYCSNFHIQLPIERFFTNLENSAIEQESIKINEMFGLLARCQPFIYKGECLIPMYREKDPICEIWTIKNKTLSLKSRFGESNELSHLGYGVAIQPTLFSNQGNLFALMRNVSRNNKYAWICKSDDGVNWFNLMQSTIPNENNSLVFIQNEKHEFHEYIVYNNDRSRSDILLFNTKTKSSISIKAKIRNLDSYSYPNFAWSDNELHIVHSNCRLIAHHTFSIEYLSKAFGL